MPILQLQCHLITKFKYNQLFLEEFECVKNTRSVFISMLK